MRCGKLLAGSFTTAVLASGLIAPVTAEAACGGALADLGLQPQCSPTTPVPIAPDPGGSESPDQPVPPAGKPFGFSSALYMSGRASAEQELDFADRAGATVHRTPVAWRMLQPTASTPLPTPDGQVHPDSAIARVDRFYAEVLERGMTPVFTAQSAPVWATRYRTCALLDFDCRKMAQSSHSLVPDWNFMDEYQAFVASMKARWPRALIETWNEPNLYWGHPDYQGSKAFAASPEQFKAMQCAAYAGSQSVNTDPVLAPGWAVVGGGYEYIRRVYAAGGAACWDLANGHVYPVSQTHFGAGSAVAQVLDQLRQIRAQYGDTDPIWITETGYTNTGDFAVSTAKQADGSRRLYNRFVTMPDVAAVLFHTVRDAPMEYHDDPSKPSYGYGFLYSGWGPKPVYCQFTARAGSPAC